jgi:hypothetical protein
VEGELFADRPAWNEKIYASQGDTHVAPQTLISGTPHTIQLGTVVGVLIGRKHLSVPLQRFWLPTKFDSGHSPAI